MIDGTPLGLDGDELAACVACGLCLPHCPTYRVTGLELASPRGRIAAMREVEQRGAAIDATFLRAIDECVQCRACEAACPSSVPFGHMVESTRAALVTGRASPTRRSRLRRMLEWLGYEVVLPHRWVLRATSWVLLLAQRARLVPRRVGAPRLTVAALRTRLAADVPRALDATADAWLFRGCVMDAWLRPTHAAALRVLHATGARVALGDAACCGALHLHAGRRDGARALARRVVASMPGDAPIVADSAGCGAAMRDYGRLLATDDARAFASRVVDFASYVVARGVPPMRSQDTAVVVADPCHLRHVQRVHGDVRTLLAGAFELRETDDDGMCCGAGGAYATVQPGLAGRIRARKVDAIARAGGPGCVVASANPGCVLHLRAAGVDARHPADLAAGALVGGSPDG